MKPKTLPPVRPSLVVDNAFKNRLMALIVEMTKSVEHWVRAAYFRNQPEIAEMFAAADADPVEELQRTLSNLSKKWQKRFDDGSERLAEYFLKDVDARTDLELKRILKKAGFSVRFKLTKGQRAVAKASVRANVALIKSIPEQYLKQVEGSVMRAFQVGGDLKALTDEIVAHGVVTRKRAAFIARDQNNKATAALARAKQLDVGISQAVWMHSSGGREPRPTHVKAGRDKVVFDLEEGWFDPAIQKYIQPGQEINCRCVSRPVLPGLS